MTDFTEQLASMSLTHTGGHTRANSVGSSTPLSASSSGVGSPATFSEYDECDQPNTGSGLTSEAEHEREVPHGKEKHESDHVDSWRCTLFIPNLPRDTTERELRNMCAFAEGFITVELYDRLKHGEITHALTGGRSTPTSPTSVQPLPSSAVNARGRLNGMVFDSTASPPVTLQARVAMKNVPPPLDHIAKSMPPLNDIENLTNKSIQQFFGSPPPGLALPGSAFCTQQQMHQWQMQVQQQQPQGFSMQPMQPAIPPFHEAQFTNGGGFASPPIDPYMNMPPPNYFYADPMAPGFSQMQAPGSQPQYGGFATYPSPTTVNSSQRSPTYAPGVGPYNPPCTTLSLARLESVSNEELLLLLSNSFHETIREYKFLVDSKGQRIAFVEFDSLASATTAQQRINGFMGLACQYSKNELRRRANTAGTASPPRF